MGIATHPLCRVLYDYFFAPTVQRWTIELTNAKQCILADAASIRKHKSVLRRRPEKGIIRLALALGWVAIHLFAMVIFAFYGAFTAGPLHATWWFWSTGVAGVMYVLLMYSDPGFVTSEELKRLSEKAGLSCDVVGSDAGRGLLQDVDGEVPDMGMLPVPPPDVEEGEAGPSSAGASGGLLEERRRATEKRRAADDDAAERAHMAAFFAARPQCWADADLSERSSYNRTEEGSSSRDASSSAPAPPLEGEDAAGADASTAPVAPAQEAAADATEQQQSPQPQQQQEQAAAAATSDVEITVDIELTPMGERGAAAAAVPPAPVQPVAAAKPPKARDHALASSCGSLSAAAGGSPDSGNLIAQARRRLDAVGGIDAIGYDLKPKGKGRHKVQPVGKGQPGTSTRALRDDQDDPDDDDDDDDGGEGGGDDAAKARRARALKHTLARNPRIVGYDEEGEAEAAEELERRAEWRRNQPLGIHDFFSGYCHEADMYAPPSLLASLGDTWHALSTSFPWRHVAWTPH